MPPFAPPKTLISDRFSVGTTYTSAKITVQYVGTIKFEITTNAADATPTWDEVSLTSAIEKSHTFSSAGSDIQYRIIGNPGTIIQTAKTVSNTFDLPGIKIELVQ